MDVQSICSVSVDKCTSVYLTKYYVGRSKGVNFVTFWMLVLLYLPAIITDIASMVNWYYKSHYWSETIL